MKCIKFELYSSKMKLNLKRMLLSYCRRILSLPKFENLSAQVFISIAINGAYFIIVNHNLLERKLFFQQHKDT